jgi:hypothetical protein
MGKFAGMSTLQDNARDRKTGGFACGDMIGAFPRFIALRADILRLLLLLTQFSLTLLLENEFPVRGVGDGLGIDCRQHHHRNTQHH